MLRINIGCGQTPTKGWRNFDNSLSVRLSKFPRFFSKSLFQLKLLEKSQHEFIEFCRTNLIEYGDPIKRLPLADASVDVLYSSHMMEHLDQIEADQFLKEVRRVLRKKGIIRLALPDLRLLSERYLTTRNLDQFMTSVHLAQPKPRTIAKRLSMIFVGTRNHHWMYDGESLCRLLASHGFINAVVVEAGKTRIPNHEPLNLRERESESVYVEAESS